MSASIKRQGLILLPLVVTVLLSMLLVEDKTYLWLMAPLFLISLFIVCYFSYISMQENVKIQNALKDMGQKKTAEENIESIAQTFQNLQKFKEAVGVFPLQVLLCTSENDIIYGGTGRLQEPLDRYEIHDIAGGRVAFAIPDFIKKLYPFAESLKDTFENLEFLIEDISLFLEQFPNCDLTFKESGDLLRPQMNRVLSGSSENISCPDILNIATELQNKISVLEETLLRKDQILKDLMCRQDKSENLDHVLEISKSLESLTPSAVGAIIDAVDSVLCAIYLMSINAAMEAAKLKEKGFVIVAKEVGKSATEAQKKMRELKILSQEIEKKVHAIGSELSQISSKTSKQDLSESDILWEKIRNIQLQDDMESIKKTVDQIVHLSTL